MGRPAARVLALLELLQARGLQSGPELVSRLGVDGRTLRRDVATLVALGIPVETERGRYGGYRLAPGFRVPPLMFTDDETLAIGLGLASARRAGLPALMPALASAQAKLERVMPDGLRLRLAALAESARFDAGGEVGTAADGAVLVTLAEAVRARRRVRLDYRADGGQASAREVDPYGLVLRRGRWYLSGHCHLRSGLRSFRLDRIEAVQTLHARFARPADFDAAAHLAGSIATLERAVPVRVFLQAEPARVAEELGEVGLCVPANGGTWLHAQTDSIEWFARQLARLPFVFRIDAPRELCAALRRHALHLARLAE